MVRAILSGTKTQTRRVIRCFCNTTHINRLLGDWSLSESPHQWDGDDDAIWRWTGNRPAKPGDWIETFQTDVDDNATAPVRCNFKPGDRLWVRETWFDSWAWSTATGIQVGIPDRYLYRADFNLPDNDKCKWKPSIFMRREACRLTLEITQICVERVQDISEADAEAEGVERYCEGWRNYTVKDGRVTTARAGFKTLWDSINAKRGFGWDVNPWVWALHFKVLSS